ncbi:MAG TPA: hypothetical protein VE990_04775 [Acidimicrobiales bacterium]|nr:hypothetical protein [Acidimicrobiales bacterium]
MGASAWARRPVAVGDWIFLALCVALAGASIADAAHPSRPTLLALVLVPAVASLLTRPVETAVLSAGCIVLAFVLPDSLYEQNQLRYVRLAAILAVCVMCPVTGFWRGRLARIELDAAVAREVAERRQRAALEINDSILQDLFAARTWLTLERTDQADQCVGRALEQVSSLVDDLLGPDHPVPGQLVRQLDPRAALSGDGRRTGGPDPARSQASGHHPS